MSAVLPLGTISLGQVGEPAGRLDLTLYPYLPATTVGQPIRAPISGLSPIRPLRHSP